MVVIRWRLIEIGRKKIPWSPDDANEAIPIAKIPKWPMKANRALKKMIALTSYLIVIHDTCLSSHANEL